MSTSKPPMLQAEAKIMATWKRHTVVISFALSLLLFVVAFFQMSIQRMQQGAEADKLVEAGLRET